MADVDAPPPTHTLPGGASVPCYLPAAGSCRLCELLDPADTSTYATSYATIVSPSGVDPASWAPPVPRPDLDRTRAIIDSIPLAGDVVEALAKAVGADRLARAWERWAGVPCGCPDRKEKMNRATLKVKRLAKSLLRARN